jgi:hypothetical protein
MASQTRFCAYETNGMCSRLNALKAKGSPTPFVECRHLIKQTDCEYYVEEEEEYYGR